MPSWVKITRTVEGKGEVPGTYLHAFRNLTDLYVLTEIEIYQDGMIGSGGISPITFEAFLEEIARGEIRTNIPKDTTIYIYPIVSFTVKDVYCDVMEEEFVKEVRDEIEQLNGRPTTLDLCRTAFRYWHEHKSEQALEKLKAAYEAVPAHNRRFFADMDVQDLPIRKLFGDLNPAEEKWFSGFEEVWYDSWVHAIEYVEAQDKR